MIGLILWGILKRFFSSWISAYAATIATIYYQSGNAFIGYDFTQVLTLYLLLGVLFLLLAIEKSFPHQNRKSATYLFFAGFFLCSAMLTKQSNGGIGAVIVVLGYCFATVKLYGIKSCASDLGKIVLGSFSILAPILLLLWVYEALPYFLDQTIFDALRAKGGEQKIFSWIGGFFGDPSYSARFNLVATYLINALFLSFAPGYLLWLSSALRFSSALKGWEPNYLSILSGCKKHFIYFCTVVVICMGLFTAYNTSMITDPSSQNAHEFTLSFLLQICIISIWCILPWVILLLLFNIYKNNK
jgi:hypothetical protein